MSVPENNQKKIEVSGLPCQPEALSRLLDICNRDDGDFSPAAAVVALDPGLTAKLLDAAFKTSGQNPQKFVSLSEVLAGLGQAAIRTIAVHSAVGHIFMRDSGQDTLDAGRYSRKALRGAYLAQLLAHSIGYANPHEAYFAGLLRDLGQLVMLNRNRDEYETLLQESKAVSELMLVEKNHFGFTHLEVAEQLIRRWHLSSFMPDAILYQHHSLEAVQGAHPLVKIVNLAAHLANRAGKLSDPQFDHGKSLFGIGSTELIELVREAEEATDQAVRDLNIETEASGKQRDLESSRYDHLARHVRTFALLSAANNHAGPSSLRDGALVALAEQLRVAFGFSVPVTFLFDSGRNCLVGHALPGQNELIGQLEIPLQQGRSLPADCLQSGELMHSFEPGLHGRRTVMDEQITRLAGGPGLLCLPLLHRGAKIGVVAIGIEESDVVKVHSEQGPLTAFAAQAAQIIASAPVVRAMPDTALMDAIPMSQARLLRVIHEVNNPLGIMKNYIKILRLKMNKEDPAQFGLGVIDEEIDRVARIVGELTETAEAPSATEEPVNINLLIFDLVCITNEPLLIRDNIRLKTELDHAVKPLRCDKNRLKQVLVNLVKNAAESMRSGGEIVISTRDEVHLDGANYVEIAVADSGPGMAPEVLAHLFEPVTSTKGDEHLGLGLNIVHGLVRELGGTIRCNSDNKNGTRFQILLPSVLSVA